MKTGSTHEIESFPGDRIAYVAAICAGLFCAVSLYWASGGTAGLHTVGGFAERMAQAGGSRSAIVIWVTVVVKAVGVILPLSLVRPWGRIVTRRWRAAACGAASVILVLYGGIQVIAEALVELDMIRPAGSVDWVALRWHLELWDSWFLLWGLLLGTATWCFHCSTRVGPTRRSLPPRSTERRRARSFKGTHRSVTGLCHRASGLFRADHIGISSSGLRKGSPQQGQQCPVTRRGM